jgi:hypothetical protein
MIKEIDNGAIAEGIRRKNKKAGSRGVVQWGCWATPLNYPMLWIQPPRFNTVPGHISY